MKYLFDINHRYFEIELGEGETKRLEYMEGFFASVTPKIILDEPTPERTGYGTLRVEYDNGRVVEIDATIARLVSHQERERLSIGQRITALRKQRGMTQAELSEKSGVNVSNLCRIETGRYSAGLDVLARIAAALGARLDLVEADE